MDVVEEQSEEATVALVTVCAVVRGIFGGFRTSLRESLLRFRFICKQFVFVIQLNLRLCIQHR